EPRRPRAGLQRVVAIDAHVAQPAAELRIAPPRTVRDGQDAEVGAAEVIVLDPDLVDELPLDERFEPDGEADVLEEAVRDAEVPARAPHADAGRMGLGAQAPGGGAPVPRGRR